MRKLGRNAGRVYILFALLHAFSIGAAPAFEHGLANPAHAACAQTARIFAQSLSHPPEYIMRLGGKSSFGEVMHIAAALAASERYPNDHRSVFVYIDHYSDSVSEFESKMEETKRNLEISKTKLIEAQNSWNGEVDRIMNEAGIQNSQRQDVLNAIATRANDGHIQLKSFQWKKLRDVKSGLEAVGSKVKAENERLLQMEKAELYSSYLQSIGLGNRIISTPVSDWPVVQPKQDFPAMEGLKGQVLPNQPTGKEVSHFSHPVRANLRESTKFASETMEKHPEFRRALAGQLVPGTIPEEVARFVDKKILSHLAPNEQARILWNRQEAYQPDRNLSETSLLEMISAAEKAGTKPVLMGSEIPAGWSKIINLKNEGRVIDFTNHWNREDSPFADRKTSNINQLKMFQYLLNLGKIESQVGMMAGVMDGPAILGVPTTAYLNDHSAANEAFDPRIQLFARALGNYHLELEPSLLVLDRTFSKK